jgi:hypothetical protein
MHASNKAREQRFHGEIATYLSPPPREPSLCTSFGTRRGLAWAPTALNVIVNAPASHRKLLRVSTGDQDGGAQVRVRPHRDVRPRRPGDDFFSISPCLTDACDAAETIRRIQPPGRDPAVFEAICCTRANTVMHERLLQGSSRQGHFLLPVRYPN